MRQIAPILSLVLIASLMIAGLLMNSIYFYAALAFLGIYKLLLLFAAINIEVDLIDKLKIPFILMFCHSYWMLGIILSPLKFLKDQRK